MQGQTQKITAYSYLKEKLLNCEFKPGQYLNEKEIVQSSCFGRTPVREALILLQAEKLVEVVPRKGTYARSIAFLPAQADASASSPRWSQPCKKAIGSPCTTI